jgi:regulator of sirC expression with transglutaminase-like and TPR domain
MRDPRSRGYGKTFPGNQGNLEAVSLRAIVNRLLTNLRWTYLQTGDYRRAGRVIERIRQLNPSDPIQ